jgi:hypothetical protein
MWSVGCIFAEILIKQPIFPGQEQKEQVQMIIDMIGYPTDDELDCFGEDKQKYKEIL